MKITCKYGKHTYTFKKSPSNKILFSTSVGKVDTDFKEISEKEFVKMIFDMKDSKVNIQ